MKKVGFTASCFDLGPHAGHIVMLKEAKSKCDHLIVALQTDPTLDRPEKNKPIQPIHERYIQLASCKFVDEIIVYSTEADLKELLLMIMPDIRFLGSDYKTKAFTGNDIEDIEIYYCKRYHHMSTSDIRKRIKDGSS
jgi:glycerol-3-phosphate cytidylyltransferase